MPLKRNTKLTVRRWPANVIRMARERRGKRIYPVKAKLALPQQKTVNIKKNGQIIKTINVRRKLKNLMQEVLVYFN